MEELFTRYPGNPILTAKDIPYTANSVFNAGAVKVGGESLLLMRVEDRRGLSHLTVARSQDGFTNWRVDPRPTLPADPVGHPEEVWGIEDPRICCLDEEERYIITYTAFSQGGPLVSLATTEDFAHFKRWGPVMPPEDKDAALFPVRFGGRYALLHRPAPIQAGVGSHIWLSFSPDLKHWGDHQILLRCRRGAWWDADKIGLAPPPLRTAEGWLLMYHGVKTTVAGGIYRLGLALLDLEDPRQVLLRGDEWVLAPEVPYEREGDVHDVVFPCGWIVEGDDIRLYYGAADTTLAAATAKVSALLDWLHRNSEVSQ
ncbi:MAG: glycosidase [Thermoleophilia bacterium]|nr:glycosidase [Thermoleophilia bacterium]